jgi:hypothetical protein
MLASPQAISRKEKGETKNLVQSLPQDIFDLSMGQAIVFDQLAVRRPLLLELRKRRSVYHGAVGSELMDVNVDQGRCLKFAVNVTRTMPARETESSSRTN